MFLKKKAHLWNKWYVIGSYIVATILEIDMTCLSHVWIQCDYFKLCDVDWCQSLNCTIAVRLLADALYFMALCTGLVYGCSPLMSSTFPSGLTPVKYDCTLCKFSFTNDRIIICTYWNHEYSCIRFCIDVWSKYGCWTSVVCMTTGCHQHALSGQFQCHNVSSTVMFLMTTTLHTSTSCQVTSMSFWQLYAYHWVVSLSHQLCVCKFTDSHIYGSQNSHILWDLHYFSPHLPPLRMKPPVTTTRETKSYVFH